jgi:hypothetical protein
MRSITFLSGVGVLLAGALSAQELPPLSYNIGGGFTQPVGTLGRYTNQGWDLQAGSGYNFLPYFGTMLDFNFNSLGINSGTATNLGIPGGTETVWSFTLDPVVHLHPFGRIDPYVIGGGGIYHRADKLTKPADGFLPVSSPNAMFNSPLVGDPLEHYYSVNKPGIDIGAGISFGTKYRAKIYAEARYNRMFVRGADTDFIPVNFGVRW